MRLSPVNWPWLTFALAILASCASPAAEIKVNTQQEYWDAIKGLQPGDAVVLANGEWRDFEILLIGEGTAEQPVTLTAETKGQVLITGQSNLRLAGKHLVVAGKQAAIEMGARAFAAFVGHQERVSAGASFRDIG